MFTRAFSLIASLLLVAESTADPDETGDACLDGSVCLAGGGGFNYEVVYLVLALVIGALSIYGLLQVFLCAMAYVRQRRQQAAS
uniref:ORF12 n=1 Tax=Steinernema glaseri TaxID=37863 RepID=A0A1I8ALG4_9BILA